MRDGFEDTTLIGNDIIEKAIHEFYQEQTEHRFMGICMAVRSRIAQDGHLLFPVENTLDEEGRQIFDFKTLELDGRPFLVAFTGKEEKEKGPKTGGLATFIDGVLENLLQQDGIFGLLINPWGETICLGKEDIALILNPGSERFA